MANEIAWEHIFPSHDSVHTSDHELQLEAVMDRALENRPALTDLSLRPAA